MTEEKVNSTSPQTNPQTKDLEAYSKAVLQLNQQEQNIKAKSGYMKAYLLSVFLPPIGLYYFIKYFFFSDGNGDNRKAAVINLVLTIVSLIINIWLLGLFFSQGISGNNQNLNMIKELITPENQKTYQQLMQ